MVLGNNLEQLKKIMSATEKRLLKSIEAMNKFNGQIEDFERRKVLRKLSQQEMTDWQGPVHYLSVHEIYKEGSGVTTPVRLVANSALHYRNRSLNSILMKGPSCLNSLFDVLIRFRSYIVGLIGDISKMYQSIKAGIVEQHCRRVIWQGCDTNKEFETYVLSTVTYGDVCAGCITTSALRLTAEMFKSVNEDAASKHINDIYVHVTTGADDRPKVEMLKECMEEIAQEGGFKFKGWTVSGDSECQGFWQSSGLLLEHRR